MIFSASPNPNKIKDDKIKDEYNFKFEKKSVIRLKFSWFFSH